MKSFVHYFCALACMASNACAMTALFTVFSRVEGTHSGDPALAVWLGCLALCQLCISFISRRGMSERTLICVCTGFFAAQLVLAFVVHGVFSSFVGTLIAAAMWVYTYYRCYAINMNGLKPDKLAASFDLACLALVFLLFFCSVKGQDLRVALPLAVSTVISLLAMVLLRGGEERKISAALMGGGLVLGIGAFAAAFIALSSGGIKRVLQLLSVFAQRIFAFILSCIDAVFRFLMSLMPEKQYDYDMPELVESLNYAEAPDMSFRLVDPRIIIAGVLGFAFLMIAAVTLWRILKGGQTIEREKRAQSRVIKRKDAGLFASVVMALKGLWAKILFKLRCIGARGTAAGLFMEIERRSRRQLQGRKDSESCREFLTRCVSVYPHAQTELAVLADALDAICFGDGHELGAGEISKLRRAIFADNEPCKD